MENGQKAEAVILVGWGTSRIGTARSLAARGIECWVCSPNRGVDGYARDVRYCRLPDPRYDERGAIRQLIALARRVGGRPIVFATGIDQWVQTLARNGDELEPLMTVCCATSDIVNTLIDKRRFTEWAGENGFSSPTAISAAAFEPGTLGGYPLAVRCTAIDPLTGFESRERRAKRFQTLRDDGDWIAFRTENVHALDDFIVQTLVHGPITEMYSIGLYADRDHEIRSMFVSRKLRGFPVDFGSATLAQNDVVPDTVLEEVRRLVKTLGYWGIAEVEYKRDVRTGRFHLIEMNPRSWGYVGITAGSAADIPWVAYRDVMGWPIDDDAEVYNRSPGETKHVRLLPDFKLALLRYPLSHRHLMISPRTWLRSLSADKLVIMEWHHSDNMMFLAIIVQLFQRASLTIGRAFLPVVRKLGIAPKTLTTTDTRSGGRVPERG